MDGARCASIVKSHHAGVTMRPPVLRHAFLFALALASCTDQITEPRLKSIAGPRAVTVTAVNGKIAFSRFANSYNDIWVMNADGTGQTNITNTPSAHEAGASLSPDGQRVAFQLLAATADIYVVNVDGTGATNLTANAEAVNDYNPSWSPAGDKIAFISTRDGAEEVYVMNADGTNQTRVTTTGGYSRPTWSPDGSKIVFFQRYEQEIYSINADGTSLTRLTNNSVDDRDPAWSPDGSKIAFARNTGTDFEIFTMNPDGTGAASLTAALAGSREPSWSPDGTRIAFVRNDAEIYVMNADGTGETNIGNTPAGEISYWPSWGGVPEAPDPDIDNDGIYNTVDTSPITVSTGFSDVGSGGATSGTIVSIPTNAAVMIDDAAGPDGVRVTVTATGIVANGARVNIALDGKNGQFKLAVPGTYVLTDPVSSTNIAVESDGPAEVQLTLNGSLILISVADGASATINETTNGSGVLTDVTVSDVTGNSGDVTVNGATVEPGSPPVPLAAMSAKLTVRRGALTLTGTWTPGGASAVDLATQDITLEVGPYSFVKIGGLTKSKTGAYTFSGTLPSEPTVQLSLELKQSKTGGPWTIKATASPVSGFANPVAVSLQIGDVFGSAQVTATLR
jgi:hypothetical protein